MQATATVSIDRTPWEAAALIAVASAQVPDGNAAFSTLAPVKISPSLPTATAPTRNFEYGEYDPRAAARAASTNSLVSIFTP
jgi:hypothetical protein